MQEYFDLRFNESPASGTSAHSCSDTFSTLKLTSSTYALPACNVHTTTTFRTCKTKRFEFVDNATSQVEECEVDLLSDNDDQNEHESVSVADLKKILMQALAWFFLHKSMRKQSCLVERSR